MMILNTNDLLDAATTALQEGRGDALTLAALEGAAADAASALARYLAAVENVTAAGPATYEAGFGGLCANFARGADGHESEAIADGDDGGGEWDDAEDARQVLAPLTGPVHRLTVTNPDAAQPAAVFEASLYGFAKADALAIMSAVWDALATARQRPGKGYQARLTGPEGLSTIGEG